MKQSFVMLNLSISILVLLSGCIGSMQPMYHQVNPSNTAVQSQKNSMPQAMLDAKSHAYEDFKAGGVGCLAGAGCGLFGIAGSYLYEGSIPIHRLQALEGKPETYQFIYKEEYIKETKRLRTKDAIGGYAAFLIFFIYLIYAGNVLSE